jgi:predicted transcriptional regulator
MASEAADDRGLSVMVDIARNAGTDLNPAQRSKLEALLAAGLIEAIAPNEASKSTRYAVTRQGQRLLDERGIGANES